ncbi:hypothetical protein D3C80_1856550 [compost metagenome]
MASDQDDDLIQRWHLTGLRQLVQPIQERLQPRLQLQALDETVLAHRHLAAIERGNQVGVHHWQIVGAFGRGGLGRSDHSGLLLGHALHQLDVAAELAEVTAGWLA